MVGIIFPCSSFGLARDSRVDMQYVGSSHGGFTPFTPSMGWAGTQRTSPYRGVDCLCVDGFCLFCLLPFVAFFCFSHSFLASKNCIK